MLASPAAPPPPAQLSCSVLPSLLPGPVRRGLWGLSLFPAAKDLKESACSLHWHLISGFAATTEHFLQQPWHSLLPPPLPGASNFLHKKLRLHRHLSLPRSPRSYSGAPLVSPVLWEPIGVFCQGSSHLAAWTAPFSSCPTSVALPRTPRLRASTQGGAGQHRDHCSHDGHC